MRKVIIFLLISFLFSPITILFSQTKIVFSSDSTGNYQIYSMNPNGSELLRLTFHDSMDVVPRLSPDGKKIAFQSNRDGDYEVYVMNSDGTNIAKLTNNNFTESEPTWSHDGSKILFRSDRDGNEEIYMMNNDGTQQTNLTNNSSRDGEGQFSPDGSKIIFSSWREGSAEIFVMNANGSNATRVTSGTTWSSEPRWSPDGLKIAYTSYGDVTISNPNGTSPVNITNSSEEDHLGSWSPDGSAIVYFNNKTGNHQIYNMLSDGSNKKRITYSSFSNQWPHWGMFNSSGQLTASGLKIVKIIDVPNDNGKNIFVVWKLEKKDSLKTIGQIQKYSVWRKDFHWWTFAGEVPAKGDTIYAGIFPTLWDSTKSNGMHWTEFQVIAHSVNLTNTLESSIDSGYSIDNLAPKVPDSLSITLIKGLAVLSWNLQGDNDFQYFAVFRSGNPISDVTDLVPFKLTEKPEFIDSSTVEGKKYYYRIASIDFAGNMSRFSKEVSFVITTIVDNGNFPKDFFLSQNYPNPFNPSTTIQFGLPEASNVTLKIYDAIGREVSTLINDQLATGYHDYNWNAEGMSSGIYFYRITASSINGKQTFTQSKKLLLMK